MTLRVSTYTNRTNSVTVVGTWTAEMLQKFKLQQQLMKDIFISLIVLHPIQTVAHELC